MRFACPASHPNLWGWDAAQHEHIFVQMVAVDQWTVTVEGVNLSNVPGDFIVSLGCSDKPYAGSGIQKSRQLAPTAELSKRKPARTSRGQLSQPGNVGDSACDNVPDCQPQPQPTFAMGGWDTTTKSYQCQTPYPYAWNMSYTQTGSPSVSAIGAIFAENPGTFDVLLTSEASVESLAQAAATTAEQLVELIAPPEHGDVPAAPETPREPASARIA